MVRAIIDLVANTSKFRARIDRVHTRLGKLRASMEAVSRVAKRMLLVGSAAATGVTVAFMTFEKRMARVKALTGSTGNEFNRLNESARELGKTTVFSANEAAEAMASFALQGFSANQIIEAMPATLNLAAAGQLAMGQAAEITAGIMRGMKLDAEDLIRVVDVIAKAATSSATDVPQLGAAMKALGPVANAAGVSLEESVAVIRAMSDVMIQGTMAGTAFRNILIRIQSGTGETSKALKALGVSIKDSSGEMKPFATIIDEIRQSMSQFDGVTQNAITTQIAGTRASAAFTEVMALGGDVIRKYTDELEGAGGTARDIADIQMETLFGSFKKLTSAASEMAISLGKEFKPAVEGAANVLKALVTKFNDLNDSTKLTITLVGGVTAAFVGFAAVAPLVLKMLGGVLFAVTALIPVIAALRLEMLILLTNPIVGMLAAVAAALIFAAKAWRDYKRAQFEARQEMDATVSAIQSSHKAFKDLHQEQMDWENRTGPTSIDEEIGYQERRVAIQKDLIEQIKAEAKQRGAAASDEQRATIIAQSEKQTRAIESQIKRERKAIVALGDEKKRYAALDAITTQRQKEREEQIVAMANRSVKANKKAAKQIEEVSRAIAIAKGEASTEQFEFVDLIHLGAGVKEATRLLDLRREVKKIDKDKAATDALKSEADLLRESVKTEAELKAAKIARIDLLLAEKQITQDVADKAKEALNVEKERQSIMGRLEGLTALRSRIAQAAGGREIKVAATSQTQKATAVAAKKTAAEVAKTAANTEATKTILDSILAIIAEVKNNLPFVGAFG